MGSIINAIRILSPLLYAQRMERLARYRFERLFHGGRMSNFDPRGQAVDPSNVWLLEVFKAQSDIEAWQFETDNGLDIYQQWTSATGGFNMHNLKISLREMRAFLRHSLFAAEAKPNNNYVCPIMLESQIDTIMTVYEGLSLEDVPDAFEKWRALNPRDSLADVKITIERTKPEPEHPTLHFTRGNTTIVVKNYEAKLVIVQSGDCETTRML